MGRPAGVQQEFVVEFCSIAFEKAMEQNGAVFTRPKEIADVRGVSYSHSLLWRFGIIKLSEDVEEKLRGRRKKR